MMRGKRLPHRRDGHIRERRRRVVIFRQAFIGNVEAPAATPRQLVVQGRDGEDSRVVKAVDVAPNLVALYSKGVHSATSGHRAIHPDIASAEF